MTETEERLKDFNDFANRFGLEGALAKVTSALDDKIDRRRMERFTSAGLISVDDLVSNHPELSPPVIEGVLRRGEIMTLASDPKAKKTWLRDQLALSILQGREWLGFNMPLERPRVMIIDNELDKALLSWRITKVAEPMGIDVHSAEYRDRLLYKACRGQLEDINQICEWICNRFEPGDFDFIAIDALYKMIPEGLSENSNSDMARIYNVLDKIAITMDAAIMVVHHASKGSQAGKAVTDVGSGAGAITRSTSTHLIMRRHEDESRIIMEGVARSFPPIDARVLYWNDTHMQWIYEPGGVIAYAKEELGGKVSTSPSRPASPDWVNGNVSTDEKAQQFVETFLPMNGTVLWSELEERGRQIGISAKKMRNFRSMAEQRKLCFSMNKPRSGGKHVSRQPIEEQDSKASSSAS